jgi:hypothetical protein
MNLTSSHSHRYERTRVEKTADTSVVRSEIVAGGEHEDYALSEYRNWLLFNYLYIVHTEWRKCHLTLDVQKVASDVQ